MKIKYEWVVLAFFFSLVIFTAVHPYLPPFSFIYAKTYEVERGGTLEGYVGAWIYDQPYGTEEARETDECYIHYGSSIDVNRAPLGIYLGSHKLDCSISGWTYVGGMVGWKATYSCKIPNDFPLGTYGLLAKLMCDNGWTVYTEEYPKTVKVVQTDSCTAGWKCKDAYTRCYQNSDCSWSSCQSCAYGCSYGECKSPPPPEEEERPIVRIKKTIAEVIFNLFRW